MRTAYIALAAAGVLALGLSGCNKGRSESADTGTAKATVSTTAPASQVPDTQLQTQAVEAATAASKPVDGSGPIQNATPPTSSPAPAPAKK